MLQPFRLQTKGDAEAKKQSASRSKNSQLAKPELVESHPPTFGGAMLNTDGTASRASTEAATGVPCLPSVAGGTGADGTKAKVFVLDGTV